MIYNYTPIRCVVIGGLVIGLLVAGVVLSSREANSIETAAAACNELSQQAPQIDCWMSVIEREFSEQGTTAAFDAFMYIYQTYDSFARSGCHKHAHRVGDLAYYYDYLTHDDLAQVDFPSSATTCGYGFYHGFFEHLFQNKPDAAYIHTTCQQAISVLRDAAPAIEQTCYHGAGHGLMLATADQFIQPAQWTVENFTKQPLEICSQLDVSVETKRECYLGVFTILTEWMSDGSYNLAYNEVTPYAHCDVVSDPEQQYGCYMEVSQKFDSVSGFNLARVRELIDTGTRPDLQKNILSLVIAGFIQHDPLADHESYLVSCKTEFPDFIDVCISSIVGGIMEHTPVTLRYATAETFCQAQSKESPERTLCYQAFVHKMKRFETPEMAVRKCATNMLPKEVCEYLEP